MNKKLQIFNHEKFGPIRTMTDERGETFFVGKDVAMALGYAKPQNALAKHVDKEDKGTAPIQGTAYETRVVIINESGLYSLILSSKLPQAKAFKRWVTSEVLPQIRQTGGYIPTHDGKGRQLTAEEILQLAEKIVGRTLRLLNGPCEDCQTATQVAQSWGMDVKSFNHLLNGMGILQRKRGRWHLTKELEGMGLARDRHFLYYSLRGRQRSRTYLVWTPKGVNYLNHRFMATKLIGPKVVQLNLFINN